MSARRKDAPTGLLLEGNDDCAVFYHLFEHYKMANRPELWDMNGFEKLRASIPVRLKASGLERLGIVVDADIDLASRWQSLHDALSNAGYVVPDRPVNEGLVLPLTNRPTVGVWVMPDNNLSGMLEHFASFLIPQDDRLWDYARDCVERLPEVRFPPQHAIKAQVHTWLAWQEEPGKPMGQAITKRYLDADAPHARQLMAWVRRLFGL